MTPNAVHLTILAVMLLATGACRRGASEHEAARSGQPAADGWFENVTRSSGLDFVHESGATGLYYFPENMGSGVALFDADGDGDLDAYLIQGGQIPGTTSGNKATNQFFRNGGDGRFVNATVSSGLGDDGYGMGCAAADFDHDGDIDIYVTNVGRNVLFRNDGGGTFEDVSGNAGVAHAGFGTSATWLDVDRDGWLDIYVANYINWSAAIEGPCFAETGPRDYCTPLTYKSQRDTLYRNNGNGTFEDISESSGVSAVAHNGLGVVAADFNDDGFDDIYVANDQQPNILWINQKDGTFVNRALPFGCALNGAGIPEASMGVLAEDFDGDGDLDLFMTHLRGETHTFFENTDGFFADQTVATRLGNWNVKDTGFGVGLVDFNHDGFRDLFIANGAVNLGGSPVDASKPYAEHNTLLAGAEGGRFAPCCDRGGDLCRTLQMSRGSAFGDIDNDGDIDVVVSNNRGPCQVFRNTVGQDRSWLLVHAVSKEDRHALGAHVTVEQEDRPQTRRVGWSSSYLSSHDPRVHFGFSSDSPIRRLTVRWADGRRSIIKDVPLNQILLLKAPAP